MNTEARRRASANLHQKRVEEGWRKVTFWLRPETVQKAESLREKVGSVEVVVNRAVMELEIDKPKPAKPTKVEPVTAPSVSVPFAGNLTRKPMQKKGK